MPVCPSCKKEQAKRVSGACPNCHAQVEVHNGRWFQTGTGSPNVAIVRHFEKLVSGSLSRGRPDKVVFSIPIIGLRYKRELVAAGRLLELCDYDLELVKSTLDLIFVDRRFSWKTRNTLLYIESEFVVALALVRANQKLQSQAAAEEHKVLTQVLQRENVFE